MEKIKKPKVKFWGKVKAAIGAAVAGLGNAIGNAKWDG